MMSQYHIAGEHQGRLRPAITDERAKHSAGLGHTLKRNSTTFRHGATSQRGFVNRRLGVSPAGKHNRSRHVVVRSQGEFRFDSES